MPVEYMMPTLEDRAVPVQLALAGKGQHRAPSIPDLLIAAAAELGGLTVLHLDKDFDLIASITGQPAECHRGLTATPLTSSPSARAAEPFWSAEVVPSGRLLLQRRSVPVAEFGSGLVGGVQELQQRLVRVRRGAHRFVG